MFPRVAPWHYFTWLFNGNSLEPPGWKPVLEGEKFTTLYIRGNVSFGHNISRVQPNLFATVQKGGRKQRQSYWFSLVRLILYTLPFEMPLGLIAMLPPGSDIKSSARDVNYKLPSNAVLCALSLIALERARHQVPV